MSYQEFIKTTFAYKDKQDDLLRMTHHQRIINILHCALGIASEYVEYLNEMEDADEVMLNSCSDTNIDQELDFGQVYKEPLKELGDLCYYGNMLYNLLDVLPHEIEKIVLEGYPSPQEAVTLGIQVELVTDLIKKKYIYEQEVFRLDLIKSLIKLFWIVDLEARDYESCLDTIVKENQAKLEKRYPKGKFDTQDSAIKADKLV